MREFFGTLDIWQILSSFIFLFAIIDPLGNIPVTLNMQRKGVKIKALNVCIATIVILLAFLFAGEWVLKLFGVKIEYFAIAGGFVIFLMALEMVLEARKAWMPKCLVPRAMRRLMAPAIWSSVMPYLASRGISMMVLPREKEPPGL